MKISCSGLPGDGADPFQEDEAAHVVDDISPPNFHGGPCDTDGAYEQSHL